MTPNLLHSLFSYRPRDGHTPEENFLTEAFAHTLRTNPEVGRAWLASMTGEPLSALGGDFHVETQASLFAPDGKSRSIPDMVVSCDLAGGGDLTVLSEHKWRSPANPGQIGRYLEIVAAKAKGHVVFIGSTAMQVADVKRVHADSVPSRPTRIRSRRSTPGCGGGASTSSPTARCGSKVRDRRCSATDREPAPLGRARGHRPSQPRPRGSAWPSTSTSSREIWRARATGSSP